MKFEQIAFSWTISNFETSTSITHYITILNFSYVNYEFRENVNTYSKMPQPPSLFSCSDQNNLK